ncbi:VWA domain-containing protein [Brachybacterium sp. YJGR34]|uniref:vWA domain-containing protein n=1 Tax=Brachybacterium sp. YJGR34 TaxID=2059911 RepID=UPI000E0A0BA0|nr:VWA domain-containing protein [Brachybacterium sp. YJGR34]
MAEPESPTPREGRAARYGAFRGGPDPLAPPLDLSAALEAMADDLLEGYSADQALREHLRRGDGTRRGLDDLAGQVQRRRRELLARHDLGGTLEEVRRLLDEAVLAERGELARDTERDATDRTLREMQIESLPSSTAAAVRELADYDWASGDARARYAQITDLLGREMLDARFAGMKQALQGATAEDREEVTQMLRDLNELLEAHARGEDTPEDFARFMERHGQAFPEGPQDVDELIDALARRSAAAQRMLRSMTDQQRQELMELSAQAFGSPELMQQLARLDSGLQALRPGEDWTGSETFEGEQGLGMGAGTEALQDLAELDRLAEQLSQDYAGSSLSDLDLEAMGRQLGEDAAVDARTLAALERALREGDLLRRDADGTLRLSPAAMRRLGRSLLRDAARRLADRGGQRDAHLAGAAGELTGARRPWEFGDTEPWDVGRTLTNALTRTAAAGADPGPPLRLRVEDVEVQETEARTRSAVALLVDTSFSMASEGRWVPMKRTALALHHLVATRFRGDRLRPIAFGRWAQEMDIEELTALPAMYEQGTNLHHALLLALRFFRRHPTMTPVLLVVTDGEPTAHLLPGGEPLFSYPPLPETLEATVAELDRAARLGAQVTFFRLGEDPGLEQFLAAMARRVGGSVVAPSPEDLGSAVVGEYLRSRRTGPESRG